MNYDNWKLASPNDDEPENECAYCGEPCQNEFCNSNCKKAYEKD